MKQTTVMQNAAAELPADVLYVLAFGAIYVLWGATFLAIRIAVLEIPPFFTAGLRFFIAGIVLHSFMRFRGEPKLTLIEWRNTALIGLCMFVATYGPLFWAEQYVSSSITSVIEASLPITTVTLEVFVFRKQRLQWRLMAGVGLGFFGIALLLVNNGGQDVAVIPCLVILAAGVAWSFGAVLSGQLDLPRSRPLTAGTQMMLGGSGASGAVRVNRRNAPLSARYSESGPCPLLLDSLRIAHRLYRVCLVARPYVGNPRRQSRLRQSRGCGGAGLLRGG
jgi:drug/metabolite transporter (DMT)-like permease